MQTRVEEDLYRAGTIIMDGDAAPDMEDERMVELSTISAIYPELRMYPEYDLADLFSAQLELPVTPSKPLTVVFPEAAENAADYATAAAAIEPRLDSHLLSHLPALQLDIKLPDGYPATQPPDIHLSTTPQWLPDNILERLTSDGARLWEEFGHDQVLFAYIDHIQQEAENAFGVLDNSDTLEVQQSLKISLLDYDIQAKKRAFDNDTYDCGVCLDPKKGSACHRMLDCGHVFCRQCLQDFYNNAITEGDLASLRCLEPSCAKERANNQTSAGKRKPKTSISPSELLQIPLEPQMVKRYVTLKRKAELESDKNTIYCPRKWCQGAARSKKHRKPVDPLKDVEVSSDDETDDTKTNGSYKLAICEDCQFAFCARCYQGWHGDFFLCIPRTTTGELTEEDKASLEYLKMHTTPCPTCAAPAQKTHGCNHMICFRCNTHFCYLCSAWLEPSNPYEHFNNAKTGCYMRLWELEGGDGDDVGIGFAGGVQREVARPDPDQLRRDAEEEALVLAQAREIAMADEPVVVLEAEPVPAAPPAPAVVREAPLVLRLGQIPARPQLPAAPVAPTNNHPNAGDARRGRRRGRGAPRQPADARAPPVDGAAARRGRAANAQNREVEAVPHFLLPHANDPILPHELPPIHRQVGVPPQRRERRVVPRRGAAARGRGGGRAVDGRALRDMLENGDGQDVQVLMNAAPRDGNGDPDMEWVARFVELALNDEEDLVEWDSGDEDEERWRIPER